MDPSFLDSVYHRNKIKGICSRHQLENNTVSCRCYHVLKETRGVHHIRYRNNIPAIIQTSANSIFDVHNSYAIALLTSKKWANKIQYVTMSKAFCKIFYKKLSSF